MASHPPPFQVEDNTDESFFDDLVNDDFNVGNKEDAASPTSTGHSVVGGNESPVAKAISNLSIDCDGNEDDDHWEQQVDNGESNWEIDPFNDHHGHNDEVHGDHHHISGSNHERADDLSGNKGTAEHFNEEESGSRSTNDISNSLAVSESSGATGIPEIKELGWSAFQTDTGNQDSNRFGSYSDFFSEFDGEKDGVALQDVAQNSVNHGDLAEKTDMSNNWEHSEHYSNGHGGDQISNMNDLNNSQDWENQYPGWAYDPSTGQWYQVDGFDAGTSVQAAANSNGAVAEGQGISGSVTDWNQVSQVSNSAETTTDWSQVQQASSMNNGVPSDWDQASDVNNGYPSHMIFDPQYPGWYYDTTVMEWCSLESYHASAQSINQVLGQMNQSFSESYDGSSQSSVHTHGQMNRGVSEPYGVSSQSDAHVQGKMNQGILESYSLSSQSTAPVHGQVNQAGYDMNRFGTISSYYHPQNSQMQPASNHSNDLYTGNIQGSNLYGQSVSVGTPKSQQKSVSVSTPMSVSGPGSQQSSDHYGTNSSYHENQSHAQNKFSMPSTFDVSGNLMPHFNDSQNNQTDQNNSSSDYYNNRRSFSSSVQQVQNAQISSYAPTSGRSSAGRPVHALVSFGFGGKLIVMKQDTFETLNYGNVNQTGGSISVLNFVEVMNNIIDTSNHGMGGSSYFQALCWQSIPGPLTGGSVGTKELNKWIDERITNLESSYMDYGKVEVSKLLLSLLKIACHYYGKLRSPYGTDAEFKESDSPESAIAKLFASAKGNRLQTSQYGAVAQCLHQIPTEGQLQVTAVEVQNLLVSGRKIEALQCAQEGQFWGPALVLAAQLGDQFYVETVKKMALHHLSAGSPLRTLCLLIASQPAEVFSGDNAAIGNMSGALNMPMPQQPERFGANGMLDDWEENLAVIIANRTKDDELVLIHLGDCLWKERNDIIAAHICYLVAEASFEPYSDSARLCLVGADHLKSPRTYASPEAIQRTELYEYSKTLGNSQFVLMPFQPYKYIYALMLAEVGRMSEALKYCQAVLKSLKTGRTPEVETLRHLVSSLEERIKGHQQGGFYTNLAPKEFIGKLLKVFDSTAHRVVGGLPPSIPPAGNTLQTNKDHHQSGHRVVSTSQSTMAMSTLMPSQSMEPISGLAGDGKGDRVVMHARSVSEPDFGRSPVQGRTESLKEASSNAEQEKASASGTSSFGSFGFGSQLFQKTIGFVLKNRRQAKLGDENKFYYDEKLKRWVEEGVAAPAPEVALPPPPTSVFQNGASDYNLKNAMKNEASPRHGNPESKSASDSNSGMPPLHPTSTNQYSARGRMGVRSRYVDTFNKGGGNATSAAQSPIVPSVKPSSVANPKFFVPMAASSASKPLDTSVNSSTNDISSTTECNPLSPPTEPPSPSPSPITMQRFPTMNTITTGEKPDGLVDLHSRRSVSWSGSINESRLGPLTHMGNGESLGEMLGMPPSPNAPNQLFSSTNNSSVGDLHEVKL